MIIETFRLEEDLMAITIREALHLVFNGRTVTRPPPLDGSREQRRAVEVHPNDIVGSLVRPRDGAGELRDSRAIVERGHCPMVGVAGLRLQPSPVDGPAIEPRRRPCLQPSLRKSEFLHLTGKPVRRALTST